MDIILAYDTTSLATVLFLIKKNKWGIQIININIANIINYR